MASTTSSWSRTTSSWSLTAKQPRLAEPPEDELRDDTGAEGLAPTSKRGAAADRTPNRGGPRKDAPPTAVRARRRILDFDDDDAAAAAEVQLGAAAQAAAARTLR